MAEFWDAYDRLFNKIENMNLVRGELIPDDIFHLVCEIIVKHTDGSYLLMQRDFKKHYGGLWELTAGGSALAGESPTECAKRELKEETGIVAYELHEIKRIVHDVHHSLYVVYLCITNWDKNSVTLQKGETVDYKWVNRSTILKMTADELASSRSLSIIQEMEL